MPDARLKAPQAPKHQAKRQHKQLLSKAVKPFHMLFHPTMQKARHMPNYKKKSASGEYGDINNFTFAGVELLGAKQGIYAYNMGYGTDSKSENTSGNPYYCVCYNYDPELCDTAYFCIDAITGKLLFSGYMGD